MLTVWHPLAASMMLHHGCIQTGCSWDRDPLVYDWSPLSPAAPLTTPSSLRLCRIGLLVHDLRIYLDSDVSMRIHTEKSVSECFTVVRQLWSVHRLLSSVRWSLFTTGLWQRNPGWHGVFSSSSCWSWTRPCDSFSLCRGMTTSLHFSANCTGWEHRRGSSNSSSSLLFSCTTVCPGTTLSYVADALEYTADFGVRRCLWSASSLLLNVHCTQLSTVGYRAFLLLLPVLETVCPNMSHLHPLCLFSEVISRLSSSSIPSHDLPQLL